MSPVAFVTGASRGIGKATAIALAEAGFDVALGARTLHEGEGRDDSSSDGGLGPLPGSLDTTAEEVRRAGRQAWMAQMDLLDLHSIERAIDDVEKNTAGIDVLVNNAIYTGRGRQQRFLETRFDDLVDEVNANTLAPLLACHLVVSKMIERGGGTIIDVTSGAAYMAPIAPPAAGGWAMGYSVSKGGFHRIAGELAFQYGDLGVRAYNLQPGFVATERVKLMQERGFGVPEVAAVEPALVGAAIALLATNKDVAENGSMVSAQQLYREHLAPGAT